MKAPGVFEKWLGGTAGAAFPGGIVRSLLAAAVMGIALAVGGCGAGPARAPVADRALKGERAPAAAPVPSAPVRPDSYVVKKGDTLYSIALDHGLDHKELARWNGIDESGRILVGQELRLSAPAGTAIVTPVQGGEGVQVRPLDSGDAAATGGLKTWPKALKLPYSEENLALLQRNQGPVPAPEAPAPPATPPEAAKPEAPAKAPPPGPGDNAAEAGTIQWSWPAKGKLLSGFNGSSNKGIDIGGKPGDPVLAAASGKVIISGVGPRGFGNLIIIKHSEVIISAYAHNARLLVREGEIVNRGQQIAEVGSTDTDRPKLHFEIRVRGEPQDPLKYLPDRS
jgi:lipoprotein NlpD